MIGDRTAQAAPPSPVPVRVYVDFDDVLCETARTFLEVVEREFGRRFAFEDLRWFDLDKSFNLTPEELGRLMDFVHAPDVLLAMPPMPGAVETLRAWAEAGVEVSVVTGRPPRTDPVCREWLARHGVPWRQLLFVDKYGRSHAEVEGVSVCAPADLAGMGFSLAVEDAPTMVRYLIEHTTIPVAVFDRPWNASLDEEPTVRQSPRLQRVSGWLELDRVWRPKASPEPRT